MNIFTGEFNNINEELIKTLESTPPTPLTAEQEEELKEIAYTKHLKMLEYQRTYRQKNKEIYNEKARLKMYNNYYSKPEYKEKQKKLYYEKKYGVSTLEEVQQVKLQRTRDELARLINKNSTIGKSKGPIPMNFETFVALKCN